MDQKPQKDLEGLNNLSGTTFDNRWRQCRIGITGANGSFGRALTKILRAKGAYIIGITHGTHPKGQESDKQPQEWVSWQCGQEKSLNKTLAKIDILVLNHGVNPQGQQSTNALNEALEVNALSVWRLIEQFEKVIQNGSNNLTPREIWVNTSEAEIQPAFSPAYEVSKRLIGQLVSLKWSNMQKGRKKNLKIRKLILGPFRSELNPIGIMNADFVAKQTIYQAELGLPLIIVTPNLFTYFIMPINELFRFIYSRLTQRYLGDN